MRFQPPVAQMTRSCLTQTTIPFGGGLDGSQPILVHAGDSISMNFYTLHRNPKTYAPDPDVFRPERWPDLRPNWDYLPFGGGARHCPAQQLALFWVGYSVVRMAMEFKEVRNRDVVMGYKEHLKLNLESGNGVKVELVRG
jgi:cytochrome P450